MGKEISWKKQKQVTTLYRKCHNIKIVAKILDIRWHTVRKYLRKNNVPISKTGIDARKEVEIVNLYRSGLSTRELGRRYSVSKNVILRILRERGVAIRQRKYDLNDKIFEEIRDEQSAYWLGFILGDGHIAKSRRNLKLGLALRDIDHLKAFKKFVETEAPIRKAIARKGEKRYESVYINICSKKICSDLSQHNVIPNKTFKTEFPTSIPHNLFHHFMRGVFDAEGSINSKHKIFCIVGTKKLLIVYQKILASECNLELTSITKCSGCYRFSYSGCFQLGRIYDFLYENASIWLERKRKIFEEVKKRTICEIAKRNTLINRIVRLYQAGSGSVDISQTYNLSPTTVLAYAKSHDIPIRDAWKTRYLKDKPKNFHDSFCCKVRLRSA